MPNETDQTPTQDRRFWVWGGRFRSVAHACVPEPSAADVVGDHVRLGPLTLVEAEREWQALMRRGVDVAEYRVLIADREPPPAP